MLLNQPAAEGYSYNVVYHVRDLIKAALAEGLDQDVLERNVARKTVIPEIAEREKPVLPVEWYARLLAGLETARDRAIFLIACFCALRPSELFGLTWDSGHPVPPDLSGAAPELFHLRQERGASHRNASTTGAQRRQNNAEHLHPDGWSGGDPNGE